MKKIKKKKSIDIQSNKKEKEENKINNNEQKDNTQINNKNENEIKEKEKDDQYFSNIKFSDMNLNKTLLERLNIQGYETATEIQAKSIPIALKGEDIIGSAKTGSGKSLAFLIPTVEYILNHLF